jgi:hypothetical protein
MMMPSRDPQHVQLETIWRQRLTRAEQRLSRAVAESKRVLSEFQEGIMVPPDGSLAVRNVHLEESRARQEYMRVLRAFTDLTLYGMTPGENADES